MAAAGPMVAADVVEKEYVKTDPSTDFVIQLLDSGRLDEGMVGRLSFCRNPSVGVVLARRRPCPVTGERVIVSDKATEYVVRRLSEESDRSTQVAVLLLSTIYEAGDHGPSTDRGFPYIPDHLIPLLTALLRHVGRPSWHHSCRNLLPCSDDLRLLLHGVAGRQIRATTCLFAAKLAFERLAQLDLMVEDPFGRLPEES